MLKKRLLHWHTKATRDMELAPGRLATAMGFMAAVLEQLGHDPEQWLLAPEGADFESRLRRAVDLQLETRRAALGGRKALVFWVFEDFLSTNQQVELARELLQEGSLEMVFLITNRWRSPEEFHVDEVFLGPEPPLYIPDRGRIRDIDFASVFWAIDCLYDTALPPGAARILQPHGTDIIFDYSVEFYGAGLLFDHLLSPSFSPQMFRPDYLERYEGIIPRCLADHGSPCLHALDTGNFKLDRFYRRCRQSTPSDIIYNLSSWDLEHAEVKAALPATLDEILRRHPDRRLVFRCFPGDEDTVRPHVRHLLELPGFFWSTAPHYLDDYANGAVLIHHRGSSAEMFSIASGRPSIRLDYGAPRERLPEETPLGRVVHNPQQLWQTLEDYLRTGSPKAEAIASFRSGKFPALGQGLRRVLEAIPAMTAGTPDPAWRRLPLAETPPGMSDQEFVRSALAKALTRDILIPILAQRALRLLPDCALARFYAARAIITHIYPDPMLDTDPWLEALEHLAEFHRLGGTETLPENMREQTREWMARFLPARIIGLVGRGASHHDEEQRRKLRIALGGLPLKFFDAGGVPQLMLEAAGRDARDGETLRSQLRDLSRPAMLFAVSPLFLKRADPAQTFLADPFLARRTGWEPGLAPFAQSPSAAWRALPLAGLEELQARLAAAAEHAAGLVRPALDATHPGRKRGPRFWTKAMGMGLVELTNLLWGFFELFEAEYRSARHRTELLEPDCYHVPLDFDDLRWLLQHSDFGMEQAFSIYMRSLRPEQPHRDRALCYQNAYRVRSVGQPSTANPRVGILGAFPAAPYMEQLVSDSVGEVAQIGFRRELNLYSTPADHELRRSLIPVPEAGSDPESRFRRYLLSSLRWLLPKSLLENFAVLERSLEEDFATQTRLTHVVSEFWIGESYECLALAVLSLRGARHVYNEHVMSCAPFLASPMHDHIKPCDMYLGCGSVREPEKPRHVPAGSLYDFTATRPAPGSPRRATYFSAKPFARATSYGGQDCAIGRGPWAPGYYEWKRRFFAALTAEQKRGLTYRRYPYDDFFKMANLAWDDAAMMSPLLDGCAMDDHTRNAKEAIADSELVLTDQLSTTFLEAAALDRPVVLLLQDADVFTPRHRPLMDRMLACGMVQSDPNAAAAFLERIWAAPGDWWHSEPVRAARAEVLATFAGRPQAALELLLALSRGAPEPQAERPLAGFVCPNPFLYAELRPGAEISPCCYLDLRLGSLAGQDVRELWNSPRAKALRTSILDGSYRFCDATRCAGMQKALRRAAGESFPQSYQVPYELHSRQELRGLGLGWILDSPPGEDAPPPAIVSLEDDPSCNLSCPSCRTAPHALSREESNRLRPLHRELARRLGQSGGELWLCGAGDPFASRAYRELLEEFDPAAHPGLRLRIDTNGVLLTPKMWERTLGRFPERVSLLAVSVDAVDAPTHARLRRGGDWEALRQNLEFLGRRRRELPGLRLVLRMIVQRDNFRQMPAFADLARAVGADRAVFSALENWGSFDEETWAGMAVHLPHNPLHEDLLAVLRHPALAAPDVDLGNLTGLAGRHATP